MTEQREGQVKVRPDLFLPRHPGDVVRLVTALAVLLVSIKLVNRDHIDELEVDAFRLVNDLPGVLYRPVWAVMQLGNVLVVPVVAGVAALTRRFRLAVNLAVAGFGLPFLPLCQPSPPPQLVLQDATGAAELLGIQHQSTKQTRLSSWVAASWPLPIG